MSAASICARALCSGAPGEGLKASSTVARCGPVHPPARVDRRSLFGNARRRIPARDRLDMGLFFREGPPDPNLGIQRAIHVLCSDLESEALVVGLYVHQFHHPARASPRRIASARASSAGQRADTVRARHCKATTPIVKQMRTAPSPCCSTVEAAGFDRLDGEEAEGGVAQMAARICWVAVPLLTAP